MASSVWSTLLRFAPAIAFAFSVSAQVPAPAGKRLPEAAGRDTLQKVCATCHPAEIVLGKGRSREGWSEVVTNMIAKGAKGTGAEFATVVEYLAKNLAPDSTATPLPPERRAPAGGGMGPDDKHSVDPAGVALGRTIYIAECVVCHSPLARGTERGADLVRSLTIIKDRYGNLIGPFLLKGHPMQSGRASSALGKAEIEQLADFLHQKLNDTLRSGPYSKVLNVLTGNVEAGKAYFNGEGRCNTCHSPAGDLAGVGKKYDAPNLQQKFLFPQAISFGRGAASPAVKAVMVTVTPPSGSPVTGRLENIDDFNVSLRDAGGEYHGWKRTPALKVEKKDPYEAHVKLLDQLTGKNMHDVVAYLETLK